MKAFAAVVLGLLAMAGPSLGAQTLAPLEVDVYHNHALSDEAIIKMSGIDQDPTLSALEVKRRLQTTSLFSEIQVTRDGNTMRIIVKEKTNWFAVPYFSSGAGSTIFGVAGGKSSVLGQNGNMLARYQFGTGDHEGSILLRDEYFLNSRWSLGVSFDYEDALHRIYQDRNVIQQTNNEYHGGSIQLGYHLSPYATLNLNTYIERHRYEEPAGNYVKGLQLSHRLSADYGNSYLNDGLARGAVARVYFEATNPASDFQFRKYGVSGQVSAFLRGDFNWIVRPRFETGTPLPRYQLFELGGSKLRSFPNQQFRAGGYVAVQNDVLLTAVDVWKLKLRPLLYSDWAFIQGSGRSAVGTGLQIYLRDVVIPAVQIFAGYGFNPNGFSATATIGPQF